MGQVRRAIEQRFDQPRALVRTRVVEEIASLGGRRDLADQVEVDAAQVLGVIGGPGGLGPWPRPTWTASRRSICPASASHRGRGARPGPPASRRLVRRWPSSAAAAPPDDSAQDEAHRRDPEPTIVHHLGPPRVSPQGFADRDRDDSYTGTSQSLIVRSSPPVARPLPSGANAIPRTTAL